MNEELTPIQEDGEKSEKRLPIWCMVCFSLAAVSTILYIIFRQSAGFSST